MNERELIKEEKRAREHIVSSLHADIYCMLYCLKQRPSYARRLIVSKVREL